MHTSNPAGLALLVRGTDLPSRLQSWLPDVPVACAATAAELAALLRDPRWRAVAIEASALGDRAEELLPRLAALFPDVPLIAIGSSGDARRLEALVASGCIQRFLRQPLGRTRTRACLEALLARPDCAARAAVTRAAQRGPTGRARRVLVALAALAALLGLAVAIASGSGAAIRTAGGAASDTRVAVSTARAAPPVAGAGEARTAADAPAAPPADVTPLLAAAADARARGALLEPHGDNAVHYYRIAIAAAPTDGRARLALADVGAALLAAGEAALAARRYSEAVARADQAARVLGDDGRVRDLQARARSGAEDARQRAAARRDAWARAAREWSAAAAATVPTAAVGGEHG
jgi:hypothetical protein